MGVYFDANSNVFKAVLEAFDFEVTVIVATQSVPAVNPVTADEQRTTKRPQSDSKRRGPGGNCCFNIYDQSF